MLVMRGSPNPLERQLDSRCAPWEVVKAGAIDHFADRSL
jgi:hypothetical protein